MSNKINRRDFLALMGAGGAAAATLSCGSKPEYKEEWHPWFEPVEGTIPYVPRYYATATAEAEGGAYHVKVVDGRVIKVDGNPDHPLNAGSLTPRQQSIVQDLYSAERVRKPVDKDGRELTWRQTHARIDEKLAEHKGANISALTGLTTGAVNDVWTRFVGWAGSGSVVHYEPFCQSDLLTASEKVFGRAEVPLVSLEGADFVCSLGAQFLETWGDVTANSRHYAAMRHVDHGKRGKHVQVEVKMTGTGANADQVLFAKPGSETAVALGLLKAVAEKKGNGAMAAMAGDASLETAAEAANIKLAHLEHLAEELAAAESPMVLPAETLALGEHSVAHHAAVLLLNSTLGAIGKHYNYDRAKPIAHVASHQGIDQLIADMNAGNVKVLFLKDVNPVYSLPPEKKFAEALAKVDFVVALASTANETTALADMVIPVAHDLEAWGEINTYRGMDMLQQACMRPRWTAPQAEDLLLEKMAGETEEEVKPFRDVLKESWLAKMGASGDKAWRDFLKAGGKFEPIEPGANVPVAGGVSADMFSAAKDAAVNGTALVVLESARLGDGRYANRGWMQELADQMTSVSWDSWLEMSPDTASELGVRNGHHVKVEAAGQSVEVPAFIVQTASKHAVTLATGQGHTGLDAVYNRGVNAFRFFSGSLNDGSQYNVGPLQVNLSKAGGRSKMATPHVPDVGDRMNTPLTGMEPDHHSNRAIFQSIGIGALADHGDDHGDGGHGGHADKYRYMKEKDGKKISFPVHTDKDMYDDRTDTPVVWDKKDVTFYDEYKWELAIDLNSCTGCGSCTVACNAENNIPVVGRDQVIKGREMAWIRINRYVEFASYDHHGKVADHETPKVRYVPMMCQQCGNAPCESVCPSLATYHNPEGLNAMVYNRCVGTRYCANNCSYKVRRFNWYTWDFPGDLNWQLNPAVSQRHKGVMEKCTFCTQRIRSAKDTAKDEGRKVQDGEIMTACQQACPSQAISFGNVQDANSEVASKRGDARAYWALDAHLHTKPGVTYLKRVDLDSHDAEAQHG